VHAFTLKPNVAAQLNLALAKEAVRLEKAGGGLDVSNIGGFHSRERLFELSKLAEMKELEECVASAIEAADREDRAAGGSDGSSIGSSGSSAIPEAGQEEEARHAGSERLSASTPTHSWVNVSRQGHSNGLHDHQPSTWSGVYYISVPRSATTLR